MTLSINLCNLKLICGKSFLERLDIVSNNSFVGIQEYCKSADKNPKLLEFKIFIEPCMIALTFEIFWYMLKWTDQLLLPNLESANRLLPLYCKCYAYMIHVILYSVTSKTKNKQCAELRIYKDNRPKRVHSYWKLIFKLKHN